MTLAESDELPRDSIDRGLVWRLLGYLRPYRPLVTAAVLLLLLQAVLTLVGPALTQRALDRAIPARDAGLLWRYALIYLVALLAGFALEYGQTVLTVRIGQQVMYDLRMQIFAHLQRLSVPFFDRHPVGRLMTRVTNSES